MSNHHNKAAVLRHYDQEATSVSRRVERRRLRQGMFDTTRQAIRLRVEYWHLAQVGFIMAWLTATAVIVISSLGVFGE